GLLSFLGLAALVGVYIVVEQQSAPLPQVQSDSLVFAEQSVVLPLENTSPSSLKATLASARGGTGASLGSITRIVPLVNDASAGTARERAATFSEFMSALGVHPPEELMRSLSDTFFLGIHTVDKNAPVIV